MTNAEPKSNLPRSLAGKVYKTQAAEWDGMATCFFLDAWQEFLLILSVSPAMNMPLQGFVLKSGPASLFLLCTWAVVRGT